MTRSCLAGSNCAQRLPTYQLADRFDDGVVVNKSAVRVEWSQVAPFPFASCNGGTGACDVHDYKAQRLQLLHEIDGLLHDVLHRLQAARNRSNCSRQAVGRNHGWQRMGCNQAGEVANRHAHSCCVFVLGHKRGPGARQGLQ